MWSSFWVFWRKLIVTTYMYMDNDQYFINNSPDSKVQGANMGPIWDRQDPGGPHVRHVNFAIWEAKPLDELYNNIIRNNWINSVFDDLRRENTIYWWWYTYGWSKYFEIGPWQNGFRSRFLWYCSLCCSTDSYGQISFIAFLLFDCVTGLYLSGRFDARFFVTLLNLHNHDNCRYQTRKQNIKKKLLISKYLVIPLAKNSNR